MWGSGVCAAGLLHWEALGSHAALRRAAVPCEVRGGTAPAARARCAPPQLPSWLRALRVVGVRAARRVRAALRSRCEGLLLVQPTPRGPVCDFGFLLVLHNPPASAVTSFEAVPALLSELAALQKAVGGSRECFKELFLSGNSCLFVCFFLWVNSPG